MPFLPSRYRNRVSEGVDFDGRVCWLSDNTSMYLGYQVNVKLDMNVGSESFCPMIANSRIKIIHRFFLE